ncbi:MAG: flagellar biosynthesis anti-sigma factor FlgM [Planctomycetaceae bacterium]
MEVNRLGSTTPSYPVQTTNAVTNPAQARPSGVTPIDTNDQLEISAAGKLMESIVQKGDIRSERLNQIRAAIEADEYESPQKLEAALLKMLEQVEKEFTAESQGNNKS